MISVCAACESQTRLLFFPEVLYEFNPTARGKQVSSMPQKRTEAVQSWPGCPVLLTWMREMHFWLHDHPLGRQRGRVLTVGVDWSLELYCNTEQSVRKIPTRFCSTAADHTADPSHLQLLHLNAVLQAPLLPEQHTAHPAHRCCMLPQQSFLFPLQCRPLREFLLSHFTCQNKFQTHLFVQQSSLLL